MKSFRITLLSLVAFLSCTSLQPINDSLKQNLPLELEMHIYSPAKVEVKNELPIIDGLIWSGTELAKVETYMKNFNASDFTIQFAERFKEEINSIGDGLKISFDAANIHTTESAYPIKKNFTDKAFTKSESPYSLHVFITSWFFNPGQMPSGDHTNDPITYAWVDFNLGLLLVENATGKIMYNSVTNNFVPIMRPSDITKNNFEFYSSAASNLGINQFSKVIKAFLK